MGGGKERGEGKEEGREGNEEEEGVCSFDVVVTTTKCCELKTST